MGRTLLGNVKGENGKSAYQIWLDLGNLGTEQDFLNHLKVNEKGLAKAFVNFNGTGTVAIRSSHNVSSITDRGVGAYTVNLINSMADLNYSCVAEASLDTNANHNHGVSSVCAPLAVNQINVGCGNTAGVADEPYVHVAVFGN